MWMHAITVAFASAYGLKGGLTSVPKGAVTGAATAAEKAEAATGLLSSQLAKDARAYLSDIQTLTGRQFTPQQMELLKADLRENTYSRLSKEAVDLNLADFRKKVPVLRQESEKNTGQSWPKESYTASNGETKFRYYDAHHVIENKFGGKSEWWNITPALRGLEHQGGIHRAQGPADKIFGK
jgi:filamentous hemagglutinin